MTVFTRIVLTLALILAWASAWAAPQSYLLDRDRSRVSFQYDLGDQPARGFFPVESAQVVLDLQQVARSSVDVTLSVRKGRAGDVFSTSAMKSESVLDASGHPTARFVSQKVRRKWQGAEVEGLLTLRGVTRPATVQVRIIREPDAPKDNSQLVLEITGSLSRSAFGATGYQNLVGDQIDLKFFVWINRAEE